MSIEMLRILWEDVKAWWRGERRVAPRNVRGRVYARRDESGGTMSAKARLKGRMSLRVYRAARDVWEDPINVPSEED